MKKWICAILCALMVLTPIMISAESDSEKVEISFCVGDNTLSINGTDVQVETPYVVGVGVTLVPLRVITEAFGATVEWVAETKNILLTYPDVNITLQIDNNIAEVNGKAEELLSAPELTANGFTMVPLRFISETFGAEVSYDNETSLITVVKEKAVQEGSLVQGAIEEPRVGDSYFKWSMDTPADMEMTDRSFDGTQTVFEDETSIIRILLIPKPKDYDFERDFTTTKQSLQNMTLVAADKDTANADKMYMHFQAKDKNMYMDSWMYVTDKLVFSAIGVFDSTDTEGIAEGSRLLKSFDLSFQHGETYDLSNVSGNMRTFSAESMNFKIDIPKNFYMSSSEDIENEFSFKNLDIEDNTSVINVAIYSISAVGNAYELATKDYESNNSIYNPDLVKFGSLKEQSYKNINTYEYTIEIDSVSQKSYVRDVFFTKGSYVYNVSVKLKAPDPMAASTVNAILNSIEAEIIDADKVGILMRNINEREGFYTLKGNKWTMQVPAEYTEISNTGDSATLLNQRTGTMMQIDVEYSDGAAFKDLMDFALSRERELKTDKEITIIKSTEQIKLDDARFAELLYSHETDEDKLYAHELIGLKNSKVIIVTAIYEELSYGKSCLTETKNMLSSIVIE